MRDYKTLAAFFFMPFMVQLQLLECLTTIIHTIDQNGWRNIGLRCEWHLLKPNKKHRHPGEGRDPGNSTRYWIPASAE